MRHRRIRSMGAVTIRRITDRTIGRFMVMDRISGTVIGAIVAGEVIGAIVAGRGDWGHRGWRGDWDGRGHGRWHGRH